MRPGRKCCQVVKERLVRLNLFARLNDVEKKTVVEAWRGGLLHTSVCVCVRVYRGVSYRARVLCCVAK